MIFLFGRVLGKQNRLYLEYQQQWLIWAANPVGTFPSFEEWLPLQRLPYYDGMTDACISCWQRGVLTYPIDPEYHLAKNGHCPVLNKKEA